jgi:hypothetical protein
MFDADAPLDSQVATQARVVGNQLAVEQQNASVVIQEDGTVVVVTPASQNATWRSGGIPSIVEDEVRSRLSAACRFAYLLLERIDPDHRLTDVVPVAALLGAGHRPWRIATEAANNPHSGAMSMSGGDGQPVTLSPAMMRRSALFHNAERTSEDFVVLLRRQRR